jgi:DNA-binding CsgD family transcriptional regulator
MDADAVGFSAARTRAVIARTARHVSESEPTIAPGSPSGALAYGGRCHACGAALPDGGAPGIILRATIPQPIAAAVRLARRLSAREWTVFEFLGAGYDNRSIARELGVSERTVKRHVTVILAKLGLESRLQAGLAALIISFSSPDGAK